MPKNHKKLMTRFNFMASALAVVAVLILAIGGINSDQFSTRANALSVEELKEKDYIYLSDLTYDSRSKTAYKNIMKDTNVNGGTIKLRKDGEIVQYPRGMAVHAKGELIYDLSVYTDVYTRLSVDIGVDADQPTGGGKGEVKVMIYTSGDGQNWTKVENVEGLGTVIDSARDCLEVDLNIKDVKFLKFEIDDYNGNANDHVMLGDAKIVKENYRPTAESYTEIESLAEYDNRIKNGASLEDIDAIFTGHKKDILERAFVQKIGYWSIQNYYNYDTEGAERVLGWILSNQERLEYVVEVGEIKDGIRFLSILSDILEKYEGEFKDGKEAVYSKMAIALAAAYTSDTMASPFSFNLLLANYDVMDRFKHLKEYYDEGKMAEGFENFEIPLVRMVVHDPVWEEDMDWLYYWTHNKTDSRERFNGGSWWLAYRRPNYGDEKYYDLAQIQANGFHTKYNLGEYSVPFGEDRSVHYWMAFNEGGICWNTSRMGQGVYRVAGLPATGGYQPGHEVFVYYNKNSDGAWTWRMGNNIYGWGRSSTTWTGGYQYRLLLGWGNEEYTLKDIVAGRSWANNMGYILLAQANIDKYDTYQEGLLYGAIADSYQDDAEKVKVYEKALEKSGYMNLDFYEELIRLYEKMEAEETATAESNENKWHDLADKIVTYYAYHPQTMYDLLEKGEGRGSGVSQAWEGVKSHLMDSAHLADILIREREALENAAALTAEDKNKYPQWTEIRSIAQLILGLKSEPIATFSFDGEHAGEVVVSDAYRVKWSYCVNDTICESPAHPTTEDKTMKLSAEELEKINPNPETLENEDQSFTISLKIEGTNTPYTIDIEPGYVEGVYQNNEDKRLVGNINNLEWRISEKQDMGEDMYPEAAIPCPDGSGWKDYSVEKPDLTGFSKTVEVRPKAHGNYRTGKVKTYKFSDETVFAGLVDGAVAYIPSTMMHIYDVSSEASEQNYNAKNLIDGDLNTAFYTDLDGSDRNRYVIIGLDYPIAISKIIYYADTFISYKLYAGMQCDRNGSAEGSDLSSMTYCGEKGSIMQGKILGSNNPQDESSWKEIYRINNSADDLNKKPTGDTQKDVVKVEMPINSKDEYQYYKIITEKGYEDEVGKTWMSGSLIQMFQEVKKDDIKPTASIEYSTTDPTNQDVTARVVNVMPLGTNVKAKEGCVTSSGESVVIGDDGKSFTFSDNGECTFELEYERKPFAWEEDEGTMAEEDSVLGTTEVKEADSGTKVFKNEVKAKVNNISKNAPKPTLNWTDNKNANVTNQPVSVELVFQESDAPVLVYNNGIVSLNENGQPVRDLDGALITKFMKYKVKDQNDPDGDLVDAMIDPTISAGEDGTANVIQKASDVFRYDFMTNGSRTIEYIDLAGNKGSVDLSVNNIDNIPPVAVIEYSTSTLTEDPVEAKVKFYSEKPGAADSDTDDSDGLVEEEGVRITAITDINAEKVDAESLETSFAKVNDEKNMVTFSSNGEIAIIYQDAAGNVGETSAKVDYIADGQLIKGKDGADVEVADKKIKKVEPGTTLKGLSEKLESKYPLTYANSGDTVLDIEKDGEKKVGTGMKAGVYGNNYTVIVERDADGDGEVDKKDVRRAHEHLIDKDPLEAPLFEAIDMDESGGISLIDISKLHHTLGTATRAYARAGDPSGKVGLEGTQSKVTEGEQVSVKTNIVGASDLNALAAKIEQSGELKLVSCGSDDEEWIVTCNNENAKIVASRTNSTNEDTLPITLKFDAEAPGMASVRLKEVKLANNDQESDIEDAAPMEFTILAKQTVDPNGGQTGGQTGGNNGNADNTGEGNAGNNQGGGESENNGGDNTENDDRNNNNNNNQNGDFSSSGNSASCGDNSGSDSLAAIDNMIAMNSDEENGSGNRENDGNSFGENNRDSVKNEGSENGTQNNSKDRKKSEKTDKDLSEQSEADRTVKTVSIILIIVVVIGCVALVGWRIRRGK